MSKEIKRIIRCETSKFVVIKLWVLVETGRIHEINKKENIFWEKRNFFFFIYIKFSLAWFPFAHVFFKILLIYLFLFMAVLGLRFCARAFSSCGKRGPLFIAVRGPLTIAASLVVEHRLQTHRLSNCGSRA